MIDEKDVVTCLRWFAAEAMRRKLDLLTCSVIVIIDVLALNGQCVEITIAGTRLP